MQKEIEKLKELNDEVCRLMVCGSSDQMELPRAINKLSQHIQSLSPSTDSSEVSEIDVEKEAKKQSEIEFPYSDFQGKEKCVNDEHTGQALRGAYIGGFEDCSKFMRSKLKSQWVSVEDRLPEIGGYYAVIAPKSFPKNCEVIITEFYKDANMFYSESSDYAVKDATHWMPLPESQIK